MIFLAQIWAALRQHPVISVCLVVAAVAGGANYPLWEKRLEITRQHEIVLRRGETMLAALTNRARINSDLMVLGEAQEIIDRNLVNEVSMEVNLGYFYRLEKATKVRVARIDQMAGAAPAGDSLFKTVPINLQISGSYRNLLAFMRELETGPRLVRIRSYRLERQDPSGSELQLALAVELLAQP